MGVVVGCLLPACQSQPARAWRGAHHYAVGSEALALGESARAVVELERAAALLPGASEVRNHLGLAYQAEGRLPEARHAFEAALDLDCDNAAARQNLARLEALASDPDPSLVPAARRARPAREGNADGG